ncbi:hypothetical protein, partial [Nocardia higoensis]|uniref:hypothetical protein n=1 Tax=Nocardia higoensis TaxID=228599 RepID=UPI001C3F37D5
SAESGSPGGFGIPTESGSAAFAVAAVTRTPGRLTSGTAGEAGTGTTAEVGAGSPVSGPGFAAAGSTAAGDDGAAEAVVPELAPNRDRHAGPHCHAAQREGDRSVLAARGSETAMGSGLTAPIRGIGFDGPGASLSLVTSRPGCSDGCAPGAIGGCERGGAAGESGDAGIEADRAAAASDCGGCQKIGTPIGGSVPSDRGGIISLGLVEDAPGVTTRRLRCTRGFMATFELAAGVSATACVLCGSGASSAGRSSAAPPIVSRSGLLAVDPASATALACGSGTGSAAGTRAEALVPPTSSTELPMLTVLGRMGSGSAA